MSITDKILEALCSNDDKFYMTIADVRNATIQEIILYYMYNFAMNKSSRIDVSYLPVHCECGVVTSPQNRDSLIVAYMLYSYNTRFLRANVSQETKDKILEISNEYGILLDYKIQDLMNALHIERDDDMQEYFRGAIFKVHLSNTKNARNV